MASLSKSKIIAHRQCPKRLWLQINRPELVQISAATQVRFDEGNKVGDIARQNYPGGVFIETLNRAEAIAQTKEAVTKRQTIFEGAFFEENVMIRADLLFPENDGYRLVEVKSSTGVKSYHVDDVTVQSWVMEKAGCSPTSMALAYINNKFVYQGDENYEGLFSEADLSNQVKPNMSQVQSWVDAAEKTLASPVEPAIAPGEQCTDPFTCDFIDYCSPPEEGVEYPVEILPYGKAIASELRGDGYKDLREVPADRLSNPKHLKVHAATLSGSAILDPEAISQIQALQYPRYYLDFETIGFAVPIWAGTRPYMQLPFQWSCHIEQSDGSMTHKEFLDLSGNDPREMFAKTLIEAVSKDGPVIVYNAGFEGARIKELATAFPHLASGLLAIPERFFDLLPLARNYYYHPDMKGSWSIKDVLPTIAPELDYANLEVSDGAMAQEAYKEAIHSQTTPERKEVVRRAMLKYCEQDTIAMLKIVRAWSAD
ncbi:DUF2779 domain-containing protein [Polynucleobacter paneuropaeus]|jgi:hypothetical protein|uniref:DUF2779 domain-containing protein n=1 Tax=Polynucleobacter paneuropaeus TaxID=2527775 RepID=UPI002043C62F|nr:DUF2779 domain-containing protein [Polynucleobacter paneuropaeus]MBT8633405.1 DUF2779 domain-containing protein [Polynucleobacter paneuropaeus]